VAEWQTRWTQKADKSAARNSVHLLIGLSLRTPPPSSASRFFCNSSALLGLTFLSQLFFSPSRPPTSACSAYSPPSPVGFAVRHDDAEKKQEFGHNCDRRSCDHDLREPAPEVRTVNHVTLWTAVIIAATMAFTVVSRSPDERQTYRQRRRRITPTAFATPPLWMGSLQNKRRSQPDSAEDCRLSPAPFQSHGVARSCRTFGDITRVVSF
jgi:hypothetical protein